MATLAEAVQHDARRYMMTEKRLGSLKAEAGKRFEDADTVVPQLRLRVSPTSKSWSVIYRVADTGDSGLKGKMRRMTLGDYPQVMISRAREHCRWSPIVASCLPREGSSDGNGADSSGSYE